MSRYFLFAQPDFWSGMARVLDLGGTLNEYNSSASPDGADFRAIRSDWKEVGNDISSAMSRYEDELTADGED